MHLHGMLEAVAQVRAVCSQLYGTPMLARSRSAVAPSASVTTSTSPARKPD